MIIGTYAPHHISTIVWSGNVSLQGLFCVDGSGRYAMHPLLARAGWAVMPVDRFGRTVAAAYGPVPFWAGPRQTSTDGEDFAIFRLSDLVWPGTHNVSIECQGTVDTLQGGPGAGARPQDQRPHLWGRVWGHFTLGDLIAHKTLGHATSADVDAGRSTHWEREANDAVDRFGKLGARMHTGIANREVHLWKGFEELARENAR